MYTYFNYQIENHIGVVTLNNPPMNALCNDMVAELDQFLFSIEDDGNLRVLIVTGAGERAFMAGADVKELDKRDFVLGRIQTKQRQEVYNRLAALPVPTIAAVNGYALGAGLELTLACSIRVASEKARFGAPEINLGIIPGDGATQRLPRIIGMGRAMHMILSAEMISAEEALNYGLVTRVFGHEILMNGALEIAETLKKKAPLALMYAKEAVTKSLDTSLSVGLAFESYLHALTCASEDKREGVAAFLDKRDSNFKGK